MKLSLTGPQTITIFSVQNEQLVPNSAKSSSFATPQGYFCKDTGSLRLFIKGQEYSFVDKETSDEAIAAASNAARSEAVPEATGIAAEQFLARLTSLESEVQEVHEHLHCVEDTIYTPLKAAFAQMGSSDPATA